MLDLVVTSRLGVRLGGRPLVSTKHVEKRFSVLEYTSARSLAALAHLKPVWIIQTEREHVELIQELLATTKTIPSAVPVHVAGRLGRGFSDDEFASVDLPDQFLCLRLDSDDYYLPEPLEGALHRFADAKQGTLIDFPRGHLLDMATGRSRRKTYSTQGPFYGIVTSPHDPIAARGHHGRARIGRVCLEHLQRSWIQCIHDENDSTTFTGKPTRRDELRAMIREARRAHGQRPLSQLLARPLDAIPLSGRTQRSLHHQIGLP